MDKWWNFDTKSYDELEELPLGSVEEALPYVPDWDLDDSGGPTRSLFRLYVDQGMLIPDALEKALRAHIAPMVY